MMLSITYLLLHYVPYVDSLSKADGPVPTYLDLIRYDATTIINGLTGRTS